ncbi:MAG: hypothetical protein KDE14_11130 [Rhodobacteraceae bacterium]|nr:hypothetical protein [Paracoccaceae bacterium]
MSDNRTIRDRQETSADPILIWEDQSSGTEGWWLSRAHIADRQFFIARDELTAALVAVERNPDGRKYRVVAVTHPASSGPAEAIAAAKASVTAIVTGTATANRGSIFSWWLRRAAKLCMRQAPLAASSFATGAVLALAVSVFAVSSGLAGWPMAAIGIAIGAGGGPVLKSIAARSLAPDLGAWGRLIVATVSAGVGAALGAGAWMALFWP